MSRLVGSVGLRSLAAGLLCLLWPAAIAEADVLALKDGRFFTGRKIDKVEGGYRIHLENGAIDVKADLVTDYFKEDASGEWVPQTDAEKVKAEKGLAPWRGKWIRASRRKKYIQKELEARKLRMEQQQARRKWRHRETVKTKHFIFEHTLPDELFAEFKDLFETYYKFFTKDWKIRPSKDFGKTTINIYHDAEYFHQVSGAPRGVLGYYHPAKRDLHFYYDKDRHEFTIDVMFHEGNHMLTHMINERVWYPAWINEGLAEYYGASEWNREKKTMKVGGIQSGRLCVLWDRVKKEKWQRLEDLIRTPRVNATQYAWAWSLCHFLMTNPRYQKPFRKYFVALGKGKGVRRRPLSMGLLQIEPDEQIKHFLKMLKLDSLEALEAEWHDYIKTALALDNVELDYAGAGWIMAIYGEDKTARRFFRKAIESGQANSFVHYSYASLLLNGGKSEWGEAAEHAKKATQLDPLHARSWFVLGQAYLYMDKEEEGLRYVKLAQELDPDDERIWVWLAWREDMENEKPK